VVAEFRVARRDVTRDTLRKAEATEEPQRAGQLLLAVETFLFRRGERRRGRLGNLVRLFALTPRDLFSCLDHAHKLSFTHCLPDRRVA
jgi:hypothetical protein